MTTENKPWVKDLLVAFAGTTLSIILTFGTSALIDHNNRNKDRKLTALMVLSSIESSARSLEESDAIVARKDTLAHWLLNIPLADVEKLPAEALMPAIAELMTNYAVSTDKTVENIFSSNTDIWKNMGSFQFIDNVGKSYTSLRAVENDWKEQLQSMSAEYNLIMEHPESYPGKTLPAKVLSNKAVVIQMKALPQRREWLKYAVAAIRESNRNNMALIGISEEEVMAFTDEQAYSASDEATEAYFRGDFAIPKLFPDSLYTMSRETQLVDSLLNTR